MNHTNPLIVKTAMMVGLAVVIFSLLGVSSVQMSIAFALLITGVAYFLVDLRVLPRYGNSVTVLADVGLFIVTAWLFEVLFDGFRTTTFAIVFAGLLAGVGEWFFHHYLLRLGVKA